MEALRIEGLSKNFGGLQVLRGTSFSVEEGVHLAIIGPNGAGKTTLINVLIGKLPCDSGAILFFGRNITTLPTHRRVHLGLGCSFQISDLFFKLTVIDNVLIALHGISNPYFKMFRPRTAYSRLLFKAQQLLESMDLWEQRDILTMDLSHGEQRRLEIVLSLASEPKLLLLDEPTAGLAIGETSGFINMIRHLARGCTVIFSAHDMDTVFTLADRILVIYFGQVLAVGTPEEIQADSRVKEIYLGIRGGTPNVRGH